MPEQVVKSEFGDARGAPFSEATVWPARRPSVCIVSHNAYGAIAGGRSGFIGGVEWQTSLLARHLALLGHPTSLLTWDEGGPPEEMQSGVRIIKICRSNAGLPGLRFLYPKWTGLLRAARRANADVYYHNCGDCVTGQLALWCRRHRRALVFSAASDADCDARLPELKTARDRVLYRLGLRRADRVLVQTAAQQVKMRRVFGVSSTVLPMPCPGPSNGDYRPPDPSVRRLLWIGRVAPVKRPQMLIELAGLCPDAAFEMVGPLPTGPLLEAIRIRARPLRNLTIHGPVSREGVNRFYERAAVLCCTSEYEGFPNTFIEAWSHGLPVVSTFDPDNLIAEKNLGMVVRDVLGMKRAIEGLFAAPELYREMSANAREHYVQNHTIEQAMPRFIEVFGQVAARTTERRNARHRRSKRVGAEDAAHSDA